MLTEDFQHEPENEEQEVKPSSLTKAVRVLSILFVLFVYLVIFLKILILS